MKSVCKRRPGRCNYSRPSVTESVTKWALCALQIDPICYSWTGLTGGVHYTVTVSCCVMAYNKYSLIITVPYKLQSPSTVPPKPIIKRYHREHICSFFRLFLHLNVPDEFTVTGCFLMISMPVYAHLKIILELVLKYEKLPGKSWILGGYFVIYPFQFMCFDWSQWSCSS